MTAGVDRRSGSIGVDIGGTTIKALRRDRDGRVVAEVRMPTPHSDAQGTATVSAVREAVGRLGRGEAGEVTGVVVPGVVDEAAGVAIRSATLGWQDLPLRAMLEQALQTRVAFGHDIRAAAVAEIGAARPDDAVVAFLAVGTGVGAAVLVDGRPVVSGGWAGEIGQLVILEGPHRGRRLDQVCSARATARRAGLPDARTVARRVIAGDHKARSVWDETVEALASAISMLAAVIAPGLVIVGGGLSHAGPLLLDPLRERLAVHAAGLRYPRLVRASYGDRSAAFGAALLAEGMSPASGRAPCRE